MWKLNGFNTYSLMNQLNDIDDIDSLYAKRWTDKSTKTYLFDVIKDKQSKELKKDPFKNIKKISEADLITEYYKNFLGLDQKDKLALLLNHPALTKEDFKDVLMTSIKITEWNFYYAAAGTLGTYAFYKMFLWRYHVFYNFFRKKSRFRFVPYVKYVVTGYVLLSSWVQTLNYFSTKRMESEFEKKGLFRKYDVDLYERLDKLY